MGKIKAMEKMIETYMDREQIPGLAIGVWKDGQVIYDNGFGYSDLNQQTIPDANTFFGIASITKSFVTVTIMKLAKEGKLHIDDPVQKYLPTFTLQNDRYVQDIKIKHLMSHTSGVATFKRIESLNTFNEHLEYLKNAETPLLGKPGEYFCYNNDLFLLLGAIIEKIEQKDYRGVIESSIFQPNGMTRSTFYVDEVLQDDHKSEPYERQNGEIVPCTWPKIGNYAVGGGIRSTIHDLLAYGQYLLTHHKEMRKPVHLIRGTTSYGYGLQITESYDGKTLIEHGGSQPGVSSNFGFIPEENLVIAVLANINGASASDIWLHVVNTFCGLPLQQKRLELPHFDLLEMDIKPFLGTYTTGEGYEVHIEMNGEILEVVIDQQRHSLRASNEATLVIEKNEAPLRFYFDTDENVWGLLFGMRVYFKRR